MEDKEEMKSNKTGYVEDRKPIWGLDFVGLALLVTCAVVFNHIATETVMSEVMSMTAYATLVTIFALGMVIGGLIGKKEKLPVYEYEKTKSRYK